VADLAGAKPIDPSIRNSVLEEEYFEGSCCWVSVITARQQKVLAPAHWGDSGGTPVSTDG
jgi:hypothetical protein